MQAQMELNRIRAARGAEIDGELALKTDIQGNTSLPERIAMAAQDLCGAILIKRGKAHELDAPSLIIVPPQADRRDQGEVTVLEYPKDVVLAERDAQGTMQPNQSLKLVPRAIRFSSLRASHTLLAPGVFTPIMGANATTRIVVKVGTKRGILEIRECDYYNQKVKGLVVYAPDTGSAANPTATLPYESSFVALLAIMDVRATGCRDIYNTTFRTPVDNFPIDFPTAGSQQFVEGLDGINLLYPEKPDRNSVANAPPAVPPAPPAVPPAQPPHPHGHGAPPQPTTASHLLIIDLSGNADDSIPANFIRLLLGNLPGFEEGTWHAVNAERAAKQLGQMMDRMKPRLPFADLQAAQRYFKQQNARIGLMWNESVLRAAMEAEDEPGARMKAIRPLALGENTPDGAPLPQVPTAAPGAPTRQAGRPPFDVDADAHRRMGGLFSGIHDKQDGNGPPLASDGSDGSDSDDGRGGKNNEKGKSNKRQKHGGQDPGEDEAYPTLASLVPNDLTVRQLAAMLQQEVSGSASGTAILVKAIQLVGITPRMSWGDDARDAAEAALAVAKDVIIKAGEEMPPRPASKEGVPQMINTLLGKLQKMAQKGELTRGGQENAHTNAGAHAGVVLAHLQANRPGDDFERSMAHSAQIGPSVLIRLEAFSRSRNEWEKKVRLESADKVTEGAPNDCLRYIMADKMSKTEAEVHLSASSREVLVKEVAARESAVRKAVERALRAKLAPALMKKLTATVLTFHFSKMPSLKEIAESANLVNTFGESTHINACHPVQAMAAIRSAFHAAYPEIDMSPMLAVEDDVRGLLMGKNEGGIAAEAAQTRASQLIEKVQRAFERRISDFRQGIIMADASPRDLLERDKIQRMLDEAHDANTAALGLLAAVVKQGSGGGNGKQHGSDKKRLNALFTEWRSEFGSQACIYFWARQSCERGDRCDKNHESANLKREEVDAWVNKHNADTSSKVTQTPMPSPPAPPSVAQPQLLEQAALEIAAQLFHESPSTGEQSAAGTKEARADHEMEVAPPQSPIDAPHFADGGHWIQCPALSCRGFYCDECGAPRAHPWKGCEWGEIGRAHV